MPGGSRHGAASAARGRRASWRPRQVPAPAVRRAVRAAVVVSAVSAAGDQLLHNANVALSAAFGSVTMLFVQFGGGLRQQLTAHVGLAGASLAPVFPATASSHLTRAAAPVARIQFRGAVSGVISSPLAAAFHDDQAPLVPAGRHARCRPGAGGRHERGRRRDVRHGGAVQPDSTSRAAITSAVDRVRGRSDRDRDRQRLRLWRHGTKPYWAVSLNRCAIWANSRCNCG